MQTRVSKGVCGRIVLDCSRSEWSRRGSGRIMKIPVYKRFITCLTSRERPMSHSSNRSEGKMGFCFLKHFFETLPKGATGIIKENKGSKLCALSSSSNKRFAQPLHAG